MISLKSLGIHFQKNKAHLAFWDKEKIVGVSSRIAKSLDSTVVDLLEKAKVDFPKKKKIPTVIALPYSMVKINTLMKIPNLDKTKDIEDMLILETESALKIKKETHEISPVLQLAEKDMDSWIMSAASAKKEDVVKYVNAVNNTGLQAVAVDIEPDAFRRVCPEPENVVFLYFFNEDIEYVGIFIYNGKHLIGARYLPTASYDPESLKTEINRMLEFCKRVITDYKVENYAIFSANEDNIEFMQEVLNPIKDSFLKKTSSVIAAGLALRGVE